LILIVAVLGLVFAVAQFIQPARTNPPIDAGRTLATQLGPASVGAQVLHRACDDCHSNATVWSRYSRIAPLSWAIASAVAEGRRAVNFSDWAAYAPERREALLAQSCSDASAGLMPPSVFVALRPQARLSASDVAAICAAAGKAP
jgi:hypothetical protein